MKEKVAIISVLANAGLAIIKVVIGLSSGLTSILAAGIDSLVDILSSVISYIGIVSAKKPADKKHPYGHYKNEVLGGLIITLIVFVSGVGIVYESITKFLNPEKMEVGYLAFGVMAFSAIINEIMARLKTHYGKKENSISLLSDGAHSRIDVYASLAILGGLFLTKYWLYADPLLALFVGLYVIRGSFSIGKEAIDSLLDVSAGEEIDRQIKLIAKNENIEINSLKTQKKGSAITVNLEIKLPSNLKVEKATDISNKLRESLMKSINSIAFVAIQIASHEVETSYYKPLFGKSFGWQRRGKFEKEVEGALGRGPGGDCVCPECGYKLHHKEGVPCSTIKCPNCNIFLERK